MRILALLLLLLPMIAAADEITLELSDGNEIPIERVVAEGQQILLWLPSEFGFSSRQQAVAEKLARSGVEVWMPDLHSGYFIPPGRYSLQSFSADLLLELVQQVQKRTARQLFIFVSGRMAAKVLSAVHIWQQQGVSKEQLGGLVLVSPKLYTHTPQGGEEATFIPAARATNLPVYLFQPGNTAQYWRIISVQKALEEGGAQVYLHNLPGVADGFHLRPLDDTEPQELEMTAKLPGMLYKAMRLLSVTEADYSRKVPLPDVIVNEPKRPGGDLLKPYKADHPTPALKLTDIDGNQLDLDDYKGKVVVLNFWATWCPPCVEEIPSLDRLYQDMQSQGVEVISVDVGEEVSDVREFLADKPTGFPVLLDPSAKAFKEWNSYAFPTTFVLDREQVIRYAVFGAFEWDSEEVTRALGRLLESP